MRNTIVRCCLCGDALELPETAGARSVPCRNCRFRVRVWVFPALHRAQDASAGQPLLEEGHSSCMNHPDKRAVSVCEACGKFMCALCEVDWNGERLCPGCIQHRRESDSDRTLRAEFIHYDSIALAIAIFSILMSFFSGLIAPAALYIGWRYWRAPLRPVPHGRWIMVIAMLLASLVFVSWIAFLVFMGINL